MNEADVEKMMTILNRMREEDPTWVIEQSKELKQTLVHGQGEFHLRTLKCESTGCIFPSYTITRTSRAYEPVNGPCSGRRAMIMGMSSEKGFEKLVAKVPLKEMSSYSTALSSLTGVTLPN